MNDRDKILTDAAIAVRQNAYAPYSLYTVGAALFDESGHLHVGCNVENTAFPQGVCAEANAIGAMVAAGGKKIAAIAAVGGHDELVNCTPCGACRQRIQEFSSDNTVILLLGDDGDIRRFTITELLPASFHQDRQ